MRRLTNLNIYETASHFHIIGTDSQKARYAVLKIDRNSQQTFTVGETKGEYTRKEVEELLSTNSSSSVVSANRSLRGANNSLVQTVKDAYGILGAIRFLQGYYLLVITKAKVVATIGHHDVYKIEEIQSHYIPSTVTPMPPDEQRYIKLFQSVDLTTNFYFSFTYDLSRTLQENTLALKSETFNKNKYHPFINVEEKFVWNEYLLKPFRDNLVSDMWTLEVVHGFVAQQLIELPCAKLALILIARRSAVYAGTRFLKRGMNLDGGVANDVETEQILWDMQTTPDLLTGHFTSFAQRRGSIPLFWSQDQPARGVVGKPGVIVNALEPNAITTAAHFRELRRKYGYPVSVINLVKRRGGEKTADEKKLSELFLKTVRFLNEFGQPGKYIDFISFDVARCNKAGRVIPRLEQIGLRLALRQGWFQSFKSLKVHDVVRHPLLENFSPSCSTDGQLQLQSGVSRTNCIDCLDRTNVAQFGLGKAALGFQLYSMGLTLEPVLSSASELCRIYEDLFDEHGDTMALQYAGSQLVHSIKTYKKTSVFQERSRDVIQTISRYYSNTFSDHEKQHSINIFLGIFRPYAQGKPHLWDMVSDRYLHFPIKHVTTRPDHQIWVENVYSDDEEHEDDGWEDWFEMFPEDREVYGWTDAKRTLDYPGPVPKAPLPSTEDMLVQRYRPHEITNFDSVLKEAGQLQSKKVIAVDDVHQSAFQTTSFMKIFRPGESAPKKSPLDDDDDEDDDDDKATEDDSVSSDDELCFDEDLNPPYLSPKSAPVQRYHVDFDSSNNSGVPLTRMTAASLLPTTEQVFGISSDVQPTPESYKHYEEYAKLAEVESQAGTRSESGAGMSSHFGGIKLKLDPMPEFLCIPPLGLFPMDNVYETEINEISDASADVYKKYVELEHSFQPLNHTVHYCYTRDGNLIL